MPDTSSFVYVVDDDPDSGKAIGRLLKSRGYQPLVLQSALDFLAVDDPGHCGCLVLEAGLPVLSGLQLQAILNSIGSRRPVIFLSRGATIEMTIQALRAGASDFLLKPAQAGDLIRAIDEGLGLDAQRRRARVAWEQVHSRVSTLTARERQVLNYVLLGRLNKQIAGALGTVEKTIKVHRARVMRKMHARSLPELVTMAGAISSADDSARAPDRVAAEALRKPTSPLLQNMPSVVASWVWDIRTDRVFADSRLARLFGVSEAAAQGGPLSEYLAAIHPEDTDRVSSLIRWAMASGRDYAVSYRVVRPDGGQSLLLARGRVLYDEHGAPIQFPGVVIDVSP